MIIDAKFIFMVAQLAVEFGESVIAPIVEACHQSKPEKDKEIAKKHVNSLINQHRINLNADK